MGRDPIVDVSHEIVEVNPTLARCLDLFEKQIHQHGLAPADGAENVEAFDYRLRLLAACEQPPQRA